MNDNLRNNQKRYNTKRKGQQPRKKQGSSVIDELVSALKQFLEATIENQQRLATVQEKNADVLMKIAEAMPLYLRGVAPGPRAPRRHKISAEKQKTLDIVKRLRDENMTYEEVAAYLDENNVPTLSGRGHWHAQTIHRICIYLP